MAIAVTTSFGALLATGISHVTFQDVVTPLLFICCVVAGIATIRMQQAFHTAMCVATESGDACCRNSSANGQDSKSKAAAATTTATTAWPLAVVVVALGLAAAAASCVIVGPAAVVVRSPAAGGSGYRVLGGSAAAPVAAVDALMHASMQKPAVLPPFEPTCFARVKDMHTFGCPVMDCIRDPSCTVSNTSCCAFLNLQMLTFFDRFMADSCLQDEYLVVFGTALGAFRNQTILPTTEDIDLGLTPLALQYLELNSTKEALWRHGYAFWFHEERGLWKMCPHVHHPSPHFQAVMQFNETLPSWQAKDVDNNWASAFVDGRLMWPVPNHTATCENHTTALDVQALLKVPWDKEDKGGKTHTRKVNASKAINPCALRRAATGPKGGNNAAPQQRQKYCLSETAPPVVVSQGSKPAVIAGRHFPGAENVPQ